ncbi:NHL repeat-containing protein [Paenibacillus sp. strain BS8-2]
MYGARLYAPTQITKLNGKYFIVDCWHHRVIWSEDISQPINEWKTVDFEFAGPHSIATDGDLYVVDNAGYDEVIVLGSNLKFRQRFSFIGIQERPHKTLYDATTQAFYVIASPYVLCFKKSGGVLVLDYQKHIPWIDWTYVRAISIIDGLMYFVSGPGKIVVANYANESFAIVNEYPVPNELQGMNDIYKVGSYFYLTSTQNNLGVIAPKIVRIQNLFNLASSNYEDIYSTIGFTERPYYISVFDGRVYITEIGENNGIFSFPVSDTSLLNVTHDFSFSGITTADSERKKMFPT